MKELIPVALEIANIAHWGQVDKAGQPYIWHPIRVSLCFSHPKFQIVGLLHDSVEDAGTPQDGAHLQAQIYSQFGVEIGDAIKAITHRPNEYLEHYWDRVKENSLAHMVKIEDINDNVGRLAQIPDATVQIRLAQKYQRALEVLS